MIILDTNVVSEVMRPDVDSSVQAWLDQQPADVLYLTATNLAELLTGIELLPEGNRKAGLASVLSARLEWLFGARILPFDREAAMVYATTIQRASRADRAIQVADGQIAAIALVHGFAVATRDTSPFEAAGVMVINPWEYTPTTDD